MTTVDNFAQGMLREYSTFARQCVALVAEVGDEERAADCFAMEDLPVVAERLGALRARAEDAEQHAEALERELAQVRAEGEAAGAARERAAVVAYYSAIAARMRAKSDATNDAVTRLYAHADAQDAERVARAVGAGKHVGAVAGGVR